MVRILLCCAAGMSTSLLVTKMEAAAKSKGYDTKIWAVSEKSVESEEGNFDILLIGPQIRYKLKEFEKRYANQMPVSMIDMKDYGRMNGEAVVEMAMKLYNDFYNK